VLTASVHCAMIIVGNEWGSKDSVLGGMWGVDDFA